ncbi:MAG: hypothetical protein HKN32_09890, partial [Flavobacteriales bacterium]|nr:hypothetical protein [Flavobacteriales bacterium]
MDTLRETIHSLSAEERREFRVFINRQRVRKGRKDLALFEIMLKEEELKPRELVARFYPDANMNAYHTLRKRLSQHLQDFISLKVKDEDDTAYGHVSGLIAVSRYLLSKNRPSVAKKFLGKAETLAEQNEVFELLDSIYNLQIKHAHRLELSVDELIEKWSGSRKQRELEERINMAYGIIQEKLAEVKHGGLDEDLEAITRKALRQLKVEEEALSRPSIMYMLVAMTRSSLISTKAYDRFEPYVIDAFERLENEG